MLSTYVLNLMIKYNVEKDFVGTQHLPAISSSRINFSDGESRIFLYRQLSVYPDDRISGYLIKKMLEYYKPRSHAAGEDE